MTEPRTVSWFSCGAASAVATKLIIGEHAQGRRPSETDVWPVYCETGAEHPDNTEFMGECEDWFGIAVKRIRSVSYTDTWDLWHKRRWLAGPKGALCTIELKVKPRIAFQRPDDIHVFGYTADSEDSARADRLRENFPELTIRTPLIERGITKAACLEMVRRAGLTVPAMYALGFHNNNCIPCVKATSPDYWALVRLTFPDKFERMARLARDLDVRLCRINGERTFIDEIPADWPTTNPIQPSCDFLCHIAEQDMTVAISSQKRGT